MEMGMKASQRSVREKFEKLLKEFKLIEAMRARWRGIDVEYTKGDKAIIDIMERISE